MNVPGASKTRSAVGRAVKFNATSVSFAPDVGRKDVTMPNNAKMADQTTEIIELEVSSQSDSGRSSQTATPPISETSTSSIPSSPSCSVKSASTTNKTNRSEAISSDIATFTKFDENSMIYMANACCELLHYRSAAVVVGFLELLLVAGWIGNSAFFYVRSGGVGSYPLLAGQTLAIGSTLGVIGLMFAGICYEKPKLLWPHMALQVLVIVCGIVLTLLAVISMAFGATCADTVFGVVFGNNLELVQGVLGPIWPFCLAVVFDFKAAVAIWFYILVRGCYDFLLDKKFFENNPVNHAVACGTVLRSAKRLDSGHLNEAVE